MQDLPKCSNTLKILQHLQQDFLGVPDRFGT